MHKDLMIARSGRPHFALLAACILAVLLISNIADSREGVRPNPWSSVTARAQESWAELAIELEPIESPVKPGQPVPVRLRVLAAGEPITTTVAITAEARLVRDPAIRYDVHFEPSSSNPTQFIAAFLEIEEEGDYSLHVSVSAEGAPNLISDTWSKAFTVSGEPNRLPTNLVIAGTLAAFGVTSCVLGWQFVCARRRLAEAKVETSRWSKEAHDKSSELTRASQRLDEILKRLQESEDEKHLVEAQAKGLAAELEQANYQLKDLHQRHELAEAETRATEERIRAIWERSNSLEEELRQVTTALEERPSELKMPLAERKVLERRVREAESEEKWWKEEASRAERRAEEEKNKPLGDRIDAAVGAMETRIRDLPAPELEEKAPHFLSEGLKLAEKSERGLEQIVRALAFRFVTDAGDAVEKGLAKVDDLRTGKLLVTMPELVDYFMQKSPEVESGITQALFERLAISEYKIFEFIYRFIQSGTVSSETLSAMYQFGKDTQKSTIAVLCGAFSDLLRLPTVAQGGRENRALLERILDAATNRFASFRSERYTYGDEVFRLYRYLYKCVRQKPTEPGFRVPELEEFIPRETRRKARELARQEAPSLWPQSFDRVLPVIEELEGKTLKENPFDQVRATLVDATEARLVTPRDSPEREALQAILECWLQDSLPEVSERWSGCYEEQIRELIRHRERRIAETLQAEVPKVLLEQWAAATANAIAGLPHRLLMHDSPALMELPNRIAASVCQQDMARGLGKRLEKVIKHETNGLLSEELQTLRTRQSDPFKANLQVTALRPEHPLPLGHPTDLILILQNSGQQPARDLRLQLIAGRGYRIIGEKQLLKAGVVWPSLQGEDGAEEIRLSFRVILTPGRGRSRRVKALIGYRDAWSVVGAKPIELDVKCFDPENLIAPRDLVSELFDAEVLPLPTMSSVQDVLRSIREPSHPRTRIHWEHYLHPCVIQRWEDLAAGNPHLIQLIGKELFSWWLEWEWPRESRPGYVSSEIFEESVLVRTYQTDPTPFLLGLRPLEQLALAGLIATERWSASITETSIAITLGAKMTAFGRPVEEGSDESLQGVLRRLCAYGLVVGRYGQYSATEFIASWNERNETWRQVAKGFLTEGGDPEPNDAPKVSELH